MRVFVVTPPAPVVTLEEAKAHLKRDGDDDDALITAYVAAATGHIDGPDGWLGRAIGVQILEARFGGSCGDTVRLPFPPFIELVSVSYHDTGGVEQMADLADFDAFGSDLAPVASAWPWASGSARRDGIRIRYRAGYETLPPAIRAAILLMTGDLYRNRDTTAAAGAVAIPMSTTVANLLAPFRVFA